MGASISSSHLPHELELYQQAERALIAYYGLEDRLQEVFVEFGIEEQKRLAGIRRARVWEVRPRNSAANTTATTVVFVHGGGGTPLDFAPLLPYLSDSQADFRLLCVERPGNGRSDPFDYRRCGMDLHQVTTHFLHALLTQLDVDESTPVHFVGNSVGGFCLFYALQYPHRVASVTLAGVPAGFQGMQLPFYYTILNSFIGLLIFSYAPSFRIIPLLLLWLIFRVPLQSLPDVYIDNMWRAQAMRNNLLSFYSLLDQLCIYAQTIKGWRLEDLQAITQQHFPVLFIDGPGDPFISKKQRELITLILGEKRHLTWGQGHMPWFVRPKQFAAVLEEFWNDTTTNGNTNCCSRTCGGSSNSIVTITATTTATTNGYSNADKKGE